MPPDEPYDQTTAYLMWFGWLLGFGGIHRIYLGKPVTGIIYLLTWGLLGIGQVLDLVHMGELVDTANDKQLRRADAASRRQLPAERAPRSLPAGDPKELLRLKLLDAARAHRGKLTVTRGVAATGKTFEEVEKTLDEMARSGFVEIDNDADSGAVLYVFRELT